MRNWFPDGRLWFFGVFTDLCNDVKFIFIFVIGYGMAAADDHGMKEVIRKGRWYNLVIGEDTQHHKPKSRGQRVTHQPRIKKSIKESWS